MRRVRPSARPHIVRERVKVDGRLVQETTTVYQVPAPNAAFHPLAWIVAIALWVLVILACKAFA